MANKAGPSHLLKVGEMILIGETKDSLLTFVNGGCSCYMYVSRLRGATTASVREVELNPRRGDDIKLSKWGFK